MRNGKRTNGESGGKTDLAIGLGVGLENIPYHLGNICHNFRYCVRCAWHCHLGLLNLYTYDALLRGW